MSTEIKRFLGRVLHRVLPQDATDATEVRTFVCVGGVEVPATLSRAAAGHFVVLCAPGLAAIAPESSATLRLVVPMPRLRVDVAVDIVRYDAVTGYASLRARGRPLVLRHRTVRDRLLEEALGVTATPGLQGLQTVA